MRLALALSGRRDAAGAVALARTAEDLGFQEVWVTEDYCERGAFSLAGALAVATSRMTIGIGVVNPWTRHSMLTAMETAALAELAPDRVVLGLGASNPRWMSDQLGIPFERPIGVLRRTTETIRSALSGARVVADDGRHAVDAQLAFVPPGSIPIVLGVKGEQALRLAGDVADGVLLSVLSSPAYVRWAAHRAAGVALSAYVAVRCGEDHEGAREQMRPFVAKYLGLHGDHAITRVAGLDLEHRKAFRRGWLDGVPRTDLVDDAVLDRFAVAGRPDHCRMLLRGLAAAGLDTMIVHDHGQEAPAAHLAMIRDLIPR